MNGSGSNWRYCCSWANSICPRIHLDTSSFIRRWVMEFWKYALEVIITVIVLAPLAIWLCKK